MPPVVGADLRAAFEASCLRGALPPVDLRAVCFVLAIYLRLTLIRSWPISQIHLTVFFTEEK